MHAGTMAVDHLFPEWYFDHLKTPSISLCQLFAMKDNV